MKLRYTFQITYADGRTRSLDKNSHMVADVPLDVFEAVVEAFLQGKSLDETEALLEYIPGMREDVIYGDRFVNLDGTYRKEALKRPRDISEVEFFLTDGDIRKIRGMKDPLEALCRPEEEMTVYRSDGSAVRIRSFFGEVEIKDINRRETHILSSDEFIREIFTAYL